MISWGNSDHFSFFEKSTKFLRLFCKTATKKFPAKAGNFRKFSMVAAGMAAAAVVAAGVAFAVMVVVVVAPDIGIEFQSSGKQGLHRGICVTGHAAEQPDAGLRQCHLCAAANAAANQNIHIQHIQNAGQSAVAAAAGVHHRSGNDLVIRHLVDLELLGVAKVLENLPVLISNRNFHKNSPFNRPGVSESFLFL
jgi:hypothetical protein